MIEKLSTFYTLTIVLLTCQVINDVLLGWGEFRFFRLGRENASLKLEDLLVDHEKNHFFVMDLILALLLDSEGLYRISS